MGGTEGPRGEGEMESKGREEEEGVSWRRRGWPRGTWIGEKA